MYFNIIVGQSITCIGTKHKIECLFKLLVTNDGCKNAVEYKNKIGIGASATELFARRRQDCAVEVDRCSRSIELKISGIWRETTCGKQVDAEETVGSLVLSWALRAAFALPCPVGRLKDSLLLVRGLTTTLLTYNNVGNIIEIAVTPHRSRGTADGLSTSPGAMMTVYRLGLVRARAV